MIEIISKRNWDSKKFDTGKTTVKNGIEVPVFAALLQNGLHDIEPDGSFVEVDTLSMPYEVGVSTDKIKRTRAGEVRYSDTASPSKQLAKIKTKRLKGISLKLQGYTTYGPSWPTLKECRYTTYDGIEVSQVANYKGFNLTLEIPNPQTAANVYRFSVKEYGCDYTYEEIDGQIHCKSPDGKDDIWIKALPAIDSTGSEGNVTLRLGGITAEGYQIIEKVIDPVWLGNAVGLVKVDPSVTIENGVDGGIINDAFIWNNAPDVNYGSNAALAIFDYIATEIRSTCLYVSLADYGSDTWLNGKFTLTESSGVGTRPYDGKAYRLLKSWGEGTVTWNKYDGTNTWETAGAKGASDRAATEECTISVGAGVPLDIPITADTLNNYWTGDIDNNGVIVEGDARVAGYQYHYSSEVAGMQPTFYGEYTEGDGSSNNYSLSIFDKRNFREIGNNNTIV